MTTDDATSAHSGTQQRRYEIWVRGHLGETMRSAFPALQAQPRGEDTVLTGAMADQAELYGVIAEIEALGLELLEVRRVPPRLPMKTRSGLLAANPTNRTRRAHPVEYKACQ